MKKKIFAFLTAFVILIATICSAFVSAVYAAEGNPSATPTPELSEEEKQQMEDIMPGLSDFKYKVYEWPETLTVGGLAFSIAESLYTIRNSETKESVLWNDDELTNDMKNFYSSTDWTKFEGMYESINISNICKAILSSEVIVYEKLMDSAAQEYGFSAYKEIFKAIGQTRFNEHKDAYAEAKSNNLINGTGDDKFDLFGIDGSWIDGGDTPVSKTEKTSGFAAPSTTSAPEQNATPTPMPESDPNSPYEDALLDNKYTVAQSIDIAAKAFANIVENAVYPVPYDTEALTGVVQSFEFGGSSNAIQSQYNSSSIKLDDVNGFIPFEEYYDIKAQMGSHAESEETEEVDCDSIIEDYAKVIAHGTMRANSDVDTYGKYQYSDQLFYQKVFENYQCSGGGSIDYGNLPEDMKEILRQCMQTWDSRVTPERKAIIQNGVMLYGVTYSMDLRNTPSIDAPQYLDCSSFVGQCYWRAGVLGREAVHWTTGNFVETCSLIDESQLIPGDIGQINWNSGISGGAAHIGIYIGEVNGVKYWLHCTGGYTDGIYHAPGKGIKINNYSGFKYFGKYPGL